MGEDGEKDAASQPYWPPDPRGFLRKALILAPGGTGPPVRGATPIIFIMIHKL